MKTNNMRRNILAGLVLFSGPLRALMLTPRDAEGPFYPSPGMRLADIDADLILNETALLEAGGEIVLLHGRVLDELGDPISNARVEIWQCDTAGHYLHPDDSGGYNKEAAFQGFGHSISDVQGQYRFRTIKPVPYPGRTPHIHLKVITNGEERLTTQLYLADHPLNQRDFLYRRIPSEQREQVTMRFDSSKGYLETSVDLVIA